MSEWNLANGRRAAAQYFPDDPKVPDGAGCLVVLTTVELPSPCHEARCIRNWLTVEPPEFVLQHRRDPEFNDRSCADVLIPHDSWALFAFGGKPKTIKVLHALGSVDVEPEDVLDLKKGHPLAAAIWGEIRSQSIKTQATTASIGIGVSPKLCFRDALSTAMENARDNGFHLSQSFEVVHTSAQIGGFGGGSLLYVTVKRTHP